MKRIATSPSTVVLRHGDVAHQDEHGARDVWVFQDRNQYLMHYDAAGPTGWLAALAVSDDGILWDKKGPVLELGAATADDSASASYGTTYFDGDRWHMFYLGTPRATPDLLKTPSFPYMTMKAQSLTATGPWVKQPGVRPLTVVAGTWYSHTASPGQIVNTPDGWIMIFSAATVDENGQILRTLGIARTTSLDEPWRVDAEPLFPLDEQVENASLYFEAATQTWFLFTNHIGVAHDAMPVPPQGSTEYTDAVWAYWAPDPTAFRSQDKAVVIDATTSGWSPRVIGLPSVLEIGGRLAVFYDGCTADTIGHGDRDVAVAWVDLPLQTPR